MNTRRPVPTLRLKLFVAGEAPNSALALRNLRSAVAHVDRERVELEVIDVLAEPDLARREKVVVTPTLVKVAPRPQRRIVGNLSDRRMLLAGLGLGDEGDG